LVAVSVGLDSRPWPIVFRDRSEAVAGLLTVIAIGAVVDGLPRRKLATALVIACTLLLDIVILETGIGYFRMWEVVALVAASVWRQSAA
jgi:hypothetical protein